MEVYETTILRLLHRLIKVFASCVIEYKAYVLTVSFLLGLMYSVAFRKEVF